MASNFKFFAQYSTQSHVTRLRFAEIHRPNVALRPCDIFVLKGFNILEIVGSKFSKDVQASERVSVRERDRERETDEEKGSMANEEVCVDTACLLILNSKHLFYA